MRLWVTLAVFFALALASAASCGLDSSGDHEFTVTPRPAADPTPPPIAPTPQPTPSPTPTATPSPTSSPTPTATPRPTVGGVAWWSLGSSPTPTATPRPKMIEVVTVDPIVDPVCDLSSRWGWRDSKFIRWSPDGSHVLFDFRFRWPNGPIQLYAVNAEGSQLHKIVDTSDIRHSAEESIGTPVNPPMMYFDISPDGSRIAYSTCVHIPGHVSSSKSGYWWKEYDYSYEIFVSNIDGMGTKRLTENGHFDNFPVWSPDGTRIALHFGSRPHS